MNIEMTNHATVRRQQRGISADVLECLLQFGKVSHDNRGGEVIHFDKRAKQRCRTAIGNDRFRRLDGHFDVYAVRGLDGALLTVGHRSKNCQDHNGYSTYNHRRLPCDFDMLLFEITAFTDNDWEELKAEYEGQPGYGTPGFNAGA